MARRLIGSVCAAIALGAIASAPSASADGLPVTGVTTPRGGLPGPNGQHYLTNSKQGNTTVREFGPAGNVRSGTIPGRFTIPAVGLDGTPSGISADGNTLALIRPRSSFPQSRTRLLILDAHKLTIMQRLTLKGDFSFDAISPDGSTLYFIQYLSPHDPTRYAVRSFDVQSGRLTPDPIVDPNEHAGEMRGYPMTRKTSLDGRWAYTLYDGGGNEPFVHALDTQEGRAVCVDLNGLITPSNVSRTGMRLDENGRELKLVIGNTTAAAIDTETLEARDPSVPAPASANGGDGDAFPWMLAATAALVALIGVGAIVVTRRRRESALAAPDA
jgi:hypothetical protein